MNPAIPPALRRQVFERAYGICEYCLIHQDDAYHSHHVDHIISRKHGGETTLENLALACFRCNVAKGSDIGSLLESPRRFVALYHPRREYWHDHFQLDGHFLLPLSDSASATVKVLELNSALHLTARCELATIGRYPSIAALAYLRGS